jgi:hypothetical protein
MNPTISFIEYDNRVISANYRSLMVRAKVVLVDKASGEQLPDPVTTIASPAPNGTLRIRLTDSVKPGTYYLRALNGHGELAAQSSDFTVS